MKYVPALDGLRAVAILGVLVFHALPGTLQGGFTGVDVFFVLSGYLIASVILHDLRDGSFSMREFYLRRIQRLLPNAVAMILTTLAIALVVLLPSSVSRVADHSLWTLFNLSNVYIWRNFGGYWQDVASSSPLLHTWSLAVEEQFYLLLPATLWLLAPRRRSTTLSAVAGLATASYLLALEGTFAHPVATFYLLPARAWEPLLGAALAVRWVPASPALPVHRGASSSWNSLLGWTGLALIVTAYFVTTEEQDFPGWIVLLPAGGTLAVLYAIGDRTSGAAGVTRWLARPLLVQIGKLSYSLYLWHWPLLVLGRTWCELNGYPPETGARIGAGVGVAIAIAAYGGIERPLRQRGAGRRQRLLVLAAGFSACVLAAILLSRWHPVVDVRRWFDPPHSAAPLYDASRIAASESHNPATKYADVLFAPAAMNPSLPWKSGGIRHDWGEGLPRVVVLGSSHALMYGSLLDDICRQLGVPIAFLSVQASQVEFDKDAGSAELDAARRKYLREWNPDLVVVIDRWDWSADARAPGGFEPRLRRLVGEIEPHTRRILLFTQVPVLRVGEKVNLRELVSWKRQVTGAFPTLLPDANEPIRRSMIATMEALAREDSRIRVLRADLPFTLPDGSVRYASGRKFYYLDDDHLSTEGAEQLREPVAAALEDALGDNNTLR